MNDNLTESINMDLPHLENLFGFKLSCLASSVARIATEQYFNQLDLGLTDARIVAIIGQEEPVSIKDISIKGRIDKGWISRSVTKLLNKGLLKKLQDKDDSRRVQLMLTDEGLRMHQHISQLARKRNDDILSVLTPGERALVFEIMCKLQDHSDSILEK